MASPPPAPLPPPVQIPRELRDAFGEMRRAIYTCRIVQSLTSRGRRQRRVLLVTDEHLFLCETDGTVRRVLPIAAVREAVVGGDEVLLQTARPHEEPSLLYVETGDPRNHGMPLALAALAALWAHRHGGQLPVRSAPSGIPLLNLGHFGKGGGYESPRKMLARMNPAVDVDGQVVSPTPTNSEVSEHADRVPRPGSPAALLASRRRQQTFEAAGASPDARVEEQLRALRESVLRQEAELRNLAAENRAMAQRSSAAASQGGSEQLVAALHRENAELRARLAAAQRKPPAPLAPGPADEVCTAPPSAWGVPASSAGVQHYLGELQRRAPDPSATAPPPSGGFSTTQQGSARQGSALGEVGAALRLVQEHNAALEERNGLLEQRLHAVAPEAAAAAAAFNSVASRTSPPRRSGSPSRERRRAERRRKERSLGAQLELTRAQLGLMAARVEDFERRNREMAGALHSMSPSLAPSCGQWSSPLRSADMPSLADSRVELRGRLDTLLDLKQRGLPGLEAAICQLQRQLFPVQ